MDLPGLEVWYVAHRLPTGHTAGRCTGRRALRKQGQANAHNCGPWTVPLKPCRHCIVFQDPAKMAGAILLQDDLNNVLLTLTDREAGILRMRFGLDDGVEKTLEEVGRAFNVSSGQAGSGVTVQLSLVSVTATGSL